MASSSAGDGGSEPSSSGAMVMATAAVETAAHYYLDESPTGGPATDFGLHERRDGSFVEGSSTGSGGGADTVIHLPIPNGGRPEHRHHDQGDSSPPSARYMLEIGSAENSSGNLGKLDDDGDGDGDDYAVCNASDDIELGVLTPGRSHRIRNDGVIWPPAGLDDEYKPEVDDKNEEGYAFVTKSVQWRRRRRRSRRLSNSASSFQLYTPDEEVSVVRKLDRRLVVFLALLYMLSFLDRSNIGNARVSGMEEDLLLQGGTRHGAYRHHDDWYEWALTAFYVTYIGFEWMSLLWRVIPAHIYVSMIVLSWGVTASLQAVAPSYPVLIFLRAVLGVGEAGFAGVPFYLSFFFRRDELALRTAIFISAAPLATSFASSLAWLVLKLAEGGPIAPWRLLFLVEGFPSVIASVIAWRLIPDSPQTASWLTDREKEVACIRLRCEKTSGSRMNGGRRSSIVGQETAKGRAQRLTASGWGGSSLKAREVLAPLTDPAALLIAVMFFLTNMAYSSLPVFLPTILEESMGHDRLLAQALSAPPYLVSFVLVLATAKISDSLRSRGGLIALNAVLSAAGYGFLALSGPVFGLEASSTLRYLAVYPAAVGFFDVVVLILTWTINNQPSEARRGGGFAMLQVVGQCGPLVGSRLYPRSGSPFYTSGMTVCSGAMLAVAVLAMVVRRIYATRNRRLEKCEGRKRREIEETDEEGTEEGEGLVSSSDSGLERLQRDEKRGLFRYML